MIVEFTKNINGVDFGQFGKKSVHVQLKLKHEKNEWKLFCYYVYILTGDGKMTPIDKTIFGLEFVTNAVNDCIAEFKEIKEWKHD